MFYSHMTICIRTAIKNSHTHPAYVRPTGSTLHVIATFRLLDRATALWAIPRIVLLLPLRESIIAQCGLFILVARETLMAHGSTLGTDYSKTGRTCEYFAIFGHLVYLVATCGWTVLLFIRARANVMVEGVL